MEIDRKIDNKELEEKGLVVDGVQIIPPVGAKTLAQLRHKRQIPFYTLFGRNYYQVSELKEWVESKKVNVA